MLFPLTFVFMSSMTARAFTLPHSTFGFLKGPKAEPESSGSGPNAPVQGVVGVFPLDPRSPAHSGFLRRGPGARRGPSLSPRMPFPAFLSQGRPGPAPASKALVSPPVSPLHHLQPRREMELKKKQGLQMWQKAVSKGGLTAVSLPASLKDGKQSCSGVPFTQVRHFLNGWLFQNVLFLFAKHNETNNTVRLDKEPVRPLMKLGWFSGGVMAINDIKRTC